MNNLFRIIALTLIFGSFIGLKLYPEYPTQLFNFLSAFGAGILLRCLWGD